MNPVDKKFGGPSLPSVNLIPQEIAEKTKLRAARVAALAAVLIAVGVVAAGFLLALGGKQLAKSDLDDALAAQSTALSDRDAMRETYDALETYESYAWTLAQFGYGDIDLANLLYNLLETDDDTTAIVGVEYVGPSHEGVPATGPSDALVEGAGYFQFRAQTESYEDATALAQRVEDVPGLEQVTILAESYNTPDGPVVWEVLGTVGIVDSALTGRFLFEDGLVKVDTDAVFAEEEPATPEPSPTPSPSEESE